MSSAREINGLAPVLASLIEILPWIACVSHGADCPVQYPVLIIIFVTISLEVDGACYASRGSWASCEIDREAPSRIILSRFDTNFA